MTWYHGTVRRRFKPGEMILPGEAVGCWSNPQLIAGTPDRELDSGRSVRPREVVWITCDQDEAQDWAYHSTLKALPHEIRQMPAGGAAVYEVEPFELARPVEQHSRKNAEAACARARVIREVFFDEFAQDLCDDCGEPATVGLGTNRQVCAACAG